MNSFQTNVDIESNIKGKIALEANDSDPDTDCLRAFLESGAPLSELGDYWERCTLETLIVLLKRLDLPHFDEMGFIMFKNTKAFYEALLLSDEALERMLEHGLVSMYPDDDAEVTRVMKEVLDRIITIRGKIPQTIFIDMLMCTDVSELMKMESLRESLCMLVGYLGKCDQDN